MVLKRAVACNFENVSHAKWSNFANSNTQQNCTKFSGMLGEHEKIIREKLCQKISKSDQAN